MVTAIVQSFKTVTVLGNSHIEALIVVSDGVTPYQLIVGAIPTDTPDVQAYITERQDGYFEIAPSQGTLLSVTKELAKQRLTSWEPSDVLTRNALRAVYKYVVAVVNAYNDLVTDHNRLVPLKNIPLLGDGGWSYVLNDAKGIIDAENDATAVVVEA